MTTALTREARAAELGIHPPPQTITCVRHGQVFAMSYVKHCPDELSCGCRYVAADAKRCPDCGWPAQAEPLPPPADSLVAFCGDGRHGCLAVGG